MDRRTWKKRGVYMSKEKNMDKTRPTHIKETLNYE